MSSGEEGIACGGTRFLKKAGFPRAPSGTGAASGAPTMAGGRGGMLDAVMTHMWGKSQAGRPASRPNSLFPKRLNPNG